METLLDRRPWLATLLLAVVGGAAFHLANRPEGPATGLWLVPAVVVLLGVTQRPWPLVVASLLLTGLGGIALVSLSWSPLVTAAAVVYWLVIFLGGLFAMRAAGRYLPPLLVALVFPCMLVAVDWGMGFTPLGTVLSWAYLMHDSLLLIQVASVAGIAGVTFLLGFTGAAVALLLLRPRAGRVWLPPLALSLVLLSAAVWHGGRALNAPAGPIVTVAAVHAATSPGNPDDLAGNLARVDAYRPLVAEAAARGAQVVVWPEMILSFDPGDEDTLMSELGGLARTHRLTMVLGLKDRGRNLNILRIFAPNGKIIGEYHKNHLVTQHEGSIPGVTPPAVVTTEFGALGTMICNDDTFTDLARANARLGAQIIAEPTWDWADIAALHARIPRFRAVENGLPIVRAARGGESQIIDARGRILARHDVLDDPHQVLVADLPLGDSDGATIYTRFGNVFGAIVTALLGVILGVGLLSRLGDE